MSKSKTKYVILGLLSERDLTGYEIKKIVDIRFSFFWNESYGQIYPELKKLECQNLIIVKKSQEISRREKTLYSITENGLKELRSWLEKPNEKESVRFEILLKVYFSKNTTVDVIKNHIETFMNTHEKQLEILNGFQKELSSVRDLHDNHNDILRVIDCGQKVYTAYIKWCQETMIYLKGSAKNG